MGMGGVINNVFRCTSHTNQDKEGENTDLACLPIHWGRPSERSVVWRGDFRHHGVFGEAP